jgi:hypothetical protein
MKNILKLMLCILSFTFLISCTNDKDNEASAKGFQLRKDASVVSPIVLLDENEAESYAKFTWDRSNNGVPTEATYSILVSDHDLDPDFSDAVESVVGLDLTVDARTCNLKVGQFNALINALPTFNCNQMNIDVRIRSQLGISTNALYQYSNPITVSVKGYPKSNPIIAFATSASAAGDSAKLASSDYKTFTNYEGYLYLEAGTYKFYRPDACGDFANSIVYGLSAANTGSLTVDGSTGFTVATAGHYYIKANLSETGTGSLTYSISTINTGTNGFGIFGNATRAIGFTSTTAMSYDATSKKWTVTLDLINGKKFGFKTSSAAAVATLVGSGTGTLTESAIRTFSDTGSPASEGSIKAPGNFVDNNTKTKYKVEVDLNKPRNYTYKLTVVPN